MKNSIYTLFMKHQDDIFNKFGNSLRNIRRKKGYTQIQLAKLSGVSQRAIVHCEKHSKRPTIEKVMKLASALEVSIEELLGVDQSKSKKQDNVSYKIMKKVRIIEKLPTRDQNMIFSMINTLAEKNKLKGRS